MPQYPAITEGRQNVSADLVIRVVQGPGSVVLADNLDRLLDDLRHGSRGLLHLTLEQIGGYFGIPDGAMNRTVGRLILRREQILDLIVGRVENAGAAGFISGGTAEPESDFSE